MGIYIHIYRVDATRAAVDANNTKVVNTITYSLTYMQIFQHTYIPVGHDLRYIYLHTYILVNILVRIHTYIYIYIYVPIHLHIHTQ